MNIGHLQIKTNVFLAPMAGITDLPFRIIARPFGCGIAFTEMISAAGLIRNTKKTMRYIESDPSDRPLGIQLFGNEPAILADAVKIVEQHGVDLIDFNMGCPVKKVVKTGAGAALMKDPKLAGAVMEKMRKATSLPLTVKIRSGWNARQLNALEIAKLAEDSGFDAVSIHPRSADQGFSSRADWSLIGTLKQSLHIPVIGNGDIRTPQDAARMINETKCDAVMIGRGVLGNPWLIANIVSYLNGGETFVPSLAEREALIIRHLELSVKFFGDRVGVRDFRKHLLWYTKGLHGGARFREKAGQISDMAEAIQLMHDYFC